MKLLSCVLFAFLAGHQSAAAKASLQSAMVRVKEVMTEHEAKQLPDKSALDNIERSVLKLAGEEKSTPSASWVGFLEQIRTLIETTFKTTLISKVNSTQAGLDAAWSNLSTCDHPDDLLNQSQIHSASATHIACRLQQQSLYDSYSSGFGSWTCTGHPNCDLGCALYNQLNVIPTPATTCVMAAGTEAPTIGNYLKEMKTKFIALRDNLASAKLACDACQSNTSAEQCFGLLCRYRQKQQQCDQLQATMEYHACDLRHTKCSEYTNCHQQRVRDYEAVRTGSRSAAQVYSAEWESIERIMCYINALGPNITDKETAITACKNAVYSGDRVSITFYGDAPAARLCIDRADINPGTPLFSSRWYQDLGANAEALGCASSCCGFGGCQEDQVCNMSWPAGDPSFTTCSSYLPRD
eukprot:TRINITY_DN17756_c0_g1_i1.p1 TRINITY_DN17756_c0_g1~~TRINITY_DN17756_c0_g1_i1.p1  ORF type:complete len:411 (-),score=38.96 TRINITY_DN17756_c0_g1_i1:77-1309(-)